MGAQITGVSAIDQAEICGGTVECRRIGRSYVLEEEPCDCRIVDILMCNLRGSDRGGKENCDHRGEIRQGQHDGLLSLDNNGDQRLLDFCSVMVSSAGEIKIPHHYCENTSEDQSQQGWERGRFIGCYLLRCRSGTGGQPNKAAMRCFLAHRA